MSGYRTLHLDDVDALSFEGEHGIPKWKPLRHTLGVDAFGVNAYVAENAGDQAIERHDELVDCGQACSILDGVTPPGHQEVYVVLTGSADFTVGDDTFEVRAGSIVFISDPALVREAVAREPGTTFLAVGAARGVAFEPSEWEARWLDPMRGPGSDLPR